GHGRWVRFDRPGGGVVYLQRYPWEEPCVCHYLVVALDARGRASQRRYPDLERALEAVQWSVPGGARRHRRLGGRRAPPRRRRGGAGGGRWGAEAAAASAREERGRAGGGRLGLDAQATDERLEEADPGGDDRGAGGGREAPLEGLTGRPADGRAERPAVAA